MAIVKKIRTNSKRWFDLPNPVEIFTDNGIKTCLKFYFNGFEDVISIKFSDGNSYNFTKNHRIKNIDTKWEEVGNINENFVSNNGIRLVEKRDIGVLPTMDMEVPDVHYYVLSNGLHSHNSSFIIGQVSEGIEPCRTNYYIKDLAKGKFTIRNPYLEKLLEEKGKNTEEVWKGILMKGGSVQHLDFLSEHEKGVFRTFSEISPKEVIIQASQRQKYIDQGQSLNLMIHPSVSAKDINSLFIEAWQLGVKSLYYQINVNAAQMFARNILDCKSCEG